MKYFVSFLALGDNLISLSLLDQLNEKVKVLGTNNTILVASLMNKNNNLDIKVIFDDVPSFYDIKKRGLLKAIVDFSYFIKYIKNNNINEIILEKKDFRSLLISYLTEVNISYPAELDSNVYANRRNLIEESYNKKIEVSTYPLKISNAKIIVINPITRVLRKNINHEHLETIIRTLGHSDFKIYLIDIENKYGEFSSKVDKYLTDTALKDVRSLITSCDLYIGGDSFLIHLAFYLKRNFFIIFYLDNADFLPPNATSDFYIKTHKNLSFEKELICSFKRIGLI
jgi:ADP-heptose:LPS heptosyltransferase